MKLHEVLLLPDVQSGETWFRPVSWAGLRRAYVVERGLVMAVPTSSGGIAVITAEAALLAGEWEAVSPSDVLGPYEAGGHA